MHNGNYKVQPYLQTKSSEDALRWYDLMGLYNASGAAA
jgi:hypothetical protein